MIFTLETVLILIAVGFLLLVFVAALFARFYRKVDQGKALIINPLRGEPVVTFTGGTVYPVIHRAEVMDISVKTIKVDRRGKEGLNCKDNIRADIEVTFFVRVNKTAEDVLKVAQSIGVARASTQQGFEELFSAKFSEALKTVGKQFEFEQLYTERNNFRTEILRVIGDDLHGFALDDAAIDYLEQTPLSSLDPQNILDAQGIKKITQITAGENVRTNDLRQQERMQIGSQNLAADEAVFQFDLRRADAEAKKDKEIAISLAREQNEAARLTQEEQKKTALERTKIDEVLAVAEEAKLRGQAIAQKNREREIAIEVEKVERARHLEQIARERDVQLTSIARDKEVEIQRKEIADVVRGRIVVDKTVATEEEAIKDLRVVAEAKRTKESVVIHAQAQAEEALVKQVKAAEAGEQVAKFQAKQQLLLAEAALETSERETRAKIRLAEGVQAERAAAGLADVKVKEANAAAIEKQGAAEANVIQKKTAAEAVGLETKGLAEARVVEAQAQAMQKSGLAEALVAKEKLLAQAAGDEQQGLAVVKVQEAKASAIQKTGEAEANAVREKLVAEAAGLAEKATAMKALDGVGREHEEFRLKLDKEKQVELAGIDAKKQLAEAQARVMAEAMGNAKIQIVGGDGAFFDRFVKAVSLGQSMDGLVQNSESLQTLLAEYLSGQKSLPADVKDVLSRPAITSETLRNVTVSALLSKLALDAPPPLRDKLNQLMATAKETGLD
jgi:uncharacterized membrane protein YqiK